MFTFIRDHQLNIMLVLTAICTIMAFMLLITRFLPKRRKWILIILELIAAGLIGSDRLTYIYNGDTSEFGYMMVRVSNFFVFFLTAGVVLCFNYYLEDLLVRSSIKTKCRRLTIVKFATIVEMLLVVMNLFTGFYYSFTEDNVYFRGSGFLICYVIPVVCPIIQFTVIQKYRKSFSRFIYEALFIYIFVPIIVGIIQIFTYGIAIVNMAIVLASVSMYFFTYLDINDEVMKAHKLELYSLKAEQRLMKDLFGQTAEAFAKAVEDCDAELKGHAKKTAVLAKKIAEESGMSNDECEEVYYAALLHKVASEEVLRGIKDYPYLGDTAKYCKERYDGKDNKYGLSRDEIPEIARIVAVADAWGTYTGENPEKKALPEVVIREEFLKEAGGKFDPHFSKVMVRLMDSHSRGELSETEEKLESEITCKAYREKVTLGIPVTQNITKISFTASNINDESDEARFSAPSLVIFDSFDKHVYDTEDLIESFRYVEYGEVWFDGHFICTNARNMDAKIIQKTESEKGRKNENVYTITAGRYEDHLKLELESDSTSVTLIVALSDSSKSVYIGLTGEHCKITEITAQTTGDKVGEHDIQRIAQPVSYIDHLEADLKNVQIDRWMSDSTEGVEVDGKLKISFHTQSLPEADLIWHCPYIVLYYSEDGRIGGPDYREYNLIKLNGEDQGDKEFAKNRFVMKKSIDFPGWDEWKIKNKEGIEVEVLLEKKGDKVLLRTENLGINIENVTTVTDDRGKVFVSISGDQVALTDIRIN